MGDLELILQNKKDGFIEGFLLLYGVVVSHVSNEAKKRSHNDMVIFVDPHLFHYSLEKF